MPQDVALPAGPATYVIPGSHNVDPPYSWQASRSWPYPRQPGVFESESRAPGTGLIAGPGTIAEIIPPPVLQSPFVTPTADPAKALPSPLNTGQVLAEHLYREQTKLLAPSGAVPPAPVR
jgi:hypothetical protein